MIVYSPGDFESPGEALLRFLLTPGDQALPLWANDDPRGACFANFGANHHPPVSYCGNLGAHSRPPGEMLASPGANDNPQGSHEKYLGD